MWVRAAVINRWKGGCVPPTRTIQLWLFNDTCSATASEVVCCEYILSLWCSTTGFALPYCKIIVSPWHRSVRACVRVFV